MAFSSAQHARVSVIDVIFGIGIVVVFSSAQPAFIPLVALFLVCTLNSSPLAGIIIVIAILGHAMQRKPPAMQHELLS